MLAADDQVYEWTKAIHKKYPPREFTEIYFEEMTIQEKVVFAVSWLQTEVGNGGFHQYFSNGTGSIASDTLIQLKRIGADAIAGILQRALTVFPDSLPARDSDTRNAQLERITDEEVALLDQLSDQFYDVDGDLCERVVAFVGVDFTV